jgi:hypothetical protein
MAHSALIIPLSEIDAAIAALVALRLDPSRDGQPYIDMLSAIDAIEGMGSLQDTISDLEHDLSDDSECLACGDSSCACDYLRDLRNEDRVSWGLTSQGASGGVWA